MVRQAEEGLENEESDGYKTDDKMGLGEILSGLLVLSIDGVKNRV